MHRSSLSAPGVESAPDDLEKPPRRFSRRSAMKGIVAASWSLPALTGSLSGTAFSLLRNVPVFAKSAALDLTVSWENNMLTIRGDKLPGQEMKVWYIEAFCRAGSTDRDWAETVIPHQTSIMKSDPSGKNLFLQSRLEDGVAVNHHIRVTEDGVKFDLKAVNSTKKDSEVHWGQPCIRVDQFTGFVAKAKAQEDYLPKSFIFVDGKETRMPMQPWATKARYTPGQVWCPKHVDRNDVNPRPLSEIVPSNGLIGCYSQDDQWLMATAFEPYQELFQGIISCLHADFRIGGLKAGETKKIRGKIYLVPADMQALLANYQKDFPEHHAGS